MKKHVKIDKKRLERFEFKPVKDLKQKIEKKPELKTNLRKDFRGTLEAQGIEIDEKFEEKIRKEWRNTIKSDLRKAVKEKPAEKTRYLRKILAKEPITIQVTIDKETGEHEKTLKEVR